MDTTPTIVICGRPNVGKSTLFNTLAKKRIAIVDPANGVTRDRIATDIYLGGKTYRLIDTGGIGLVDESRLGEVIAGQTRQAFDKASLILFMVDIQAGVTPLDMDVAILLKKHYSHENIWLLANKADNSRLEMEKGQFHRLGFGEPMCISAAHYQGIGELKERMEENFPDAPSISAVESPLKIAVVGKTNAGKSTFINALAQEERVIVSEIPGTTRDSIDVYFEKDGKSIIAIDTAGLKKSSNVKGNVDFYSQTRAQKAIRRSDVVLFMFDASSNISKIDKQISALIRDEYKPAIITVNKWDLAIEVSSPEQYEQYLSKTVPGFGYAPMSFITAKTGKNVAATIDLARNIFKQAARRITTGELNRVLQNNILARRKPRYQGKAGKIYYATQVGSNPPSFLFFVNNPKLFTKKYRRYLFNQFQFELGFSEVPVKLEFKEREHSREQERK